MQRIAMQSNTRIAGGGLAVYRNNYISTPQSQNQKVSEQAGHQQADHHQPFRGRMCPYRYGAGNGEGSCSPLLIIGLEFSQLHKPPE